jgi:hypothetical protein
MDFRGAQKQKAPRIAARGFLFRQNRSAGLDVGRLLAFRTLRDFESHFLIFGQGLETAALNGRKVDEEIFATAIRRDETKALGIVEPFNCTRRHYENLCIVD